MTDSKAVIAVTLGYQEELDQFHHPPEVRLYLIENRLFNTPALDGTDIVLNPQKDCLDMYRKWYMYAEHIDNIIRFVFVDTGTGIAKTVRLNWGEKIRNTLGVIKDGNLLVSTFRGDFRTGTEEEYRGNGLQNVRIKVMRGPFKRFDVISGHGKCIIDANASNENNLKCVNYKETIFGTLYCFDVC